MGKKNLLKRALTNACVVDHILIEPVIQKLHILISLKIITTMFFIMFSNWKGLILYI